MFKTISNIWDVITELPIDNTINTILYIPHKDTSAYLALLIIAIATTIHTTRITPLTIGGNSVFKELIK